MEQFEYKIILNNITFRYAKGESLEKGDEIHNQNEILLYIKGGATFLSEQFEETLREYSLLIIPKGSYHKFILNNQKEYTRIGFLFPSEATQSILPNEIKIIPFLEDDVLRLLKKIGEKLSVKEKSQSDKRWLLSAFQLLLCELENNNLLSVSPIFREQHLLISRCIDFIEKNLSRTLTVDLISKEMGVSVSALHLCFKKHLGISVYKYITEKRLIKANASIITGLNPTEVYKSCGFNDYPTFYKAYLKKFRHKPSADKK